jgi:outer membrane protein TolC
MRIGISLFILLAAAPAWAQKPASPRPAEELARELDAEVGVAGGLTAEQAAARAVSVSPAAAARAEEVALAASELRQTRLEFLPRATLSARYTRLSPTDDTSIEGLPVPVTIPGPLENQWSFGAQLAVPLSDYALRYPQATAARDHAVDAARHQSAAERRKAAAGARRAYYEWARVRLAIIVAEKSLAQAKDHQAMAEKRLAAQSVTKADVLLAEARVAEAEQLVVRARSGAAVAEKQLRIAIGQPDGALAVGENVLADLPPAAAGDQLVARALAARPELRALGANLDAIAGQDRLQRAGLLPRLDLVGNYAYADPHPRAFPQEDEFRSAWDVSAILSWSIDGAARAREARAGLDARRRQVVAERRQAIDGITLEVTAAAARVGEAEHAIDASRRALAAAEEAYRVRQRLYEVGSASSTELGDAETELTRARFGLIDAHIDLRVARVELDRAAGR